MSLYWIIVAVVNLLLGLAAGRYLERWLEPGRSLPRFPRRRSPSPPATSAVQDDPPSQVLVEPAPPQAPQVPPAETVPNTTAPLEETPSAEEKSLAAELPPDVAQQFQAASSPEELVVCAATVLGEHSREYLQGLAQLDSQTRRLLQHPDPNALHHVAEQLEQLSTRWLSVQQGALEQLTAHAAGGSTQQIEQLEHLLLEQTAQIETATNNLHMVLAGEVTADTAARLLQEIKALVRRMHQLQQQTIQVAAEVFDPQRHSGGEQHWQDGFTGMPSRLGIAHLVDQWRIEDPHSMRQASVALVGVDQLGQWNEQLGVEVGDWLLRCLAQALPQAVRQNRGFDRVGYYGGDCFLVFLGDASPHNASVVAERIRQSVEQGQFLGPEGPVPLRVSCGVVGCLPGESFQGTCARAEETLQYAKQNGRNCTAVHDGTQMSVIQAPPLKILQWAFEFSLDGQPLAAASSPAD